MITLEHKLRMLAIPVLEDGVVSLGETTLILRTIRPYVGKGDPEVDGLMELLQQVRADGIVEPDESGRIVALLHEITVERAKRRRADQTSAATTQKEKNNG